jgi:hypothetical protein
MTDGPHSYTTVRRNLLGVIGLLSLAVGIYFYVRPPDVASVEFVQGSCIKSGFVLLAAWLAFPQLDRMPGWLFAVLVGGLLTVAVRPRLVIVALRAGLYVLPVLALIWLLRRLAPRQSVQ